MVRLDTEKRNETLVTLQTAACRMASKPPSGASRLRDTICFCTSSLKRSTLSVSERMWRKPKVGTQLGKGLYLRQGTDTSGMYELIDLTHSTLLKNKNQLISCELLMACFVSGLFFHPLEFSRDAVMYTIKYLQPVLHIQQQSCNLDRK